MIAVIFAEDSFEIAVTIMDEQYFEAFLDGLSQGAQLYGAGRCTAYLWPRDEAEMRRDENPATVDAAILFIQRL